MCRVAYNNKNDYLDTYMDNENDDRCKKGNNGLYFFMRFSLKTSNLE